MKGKGGEIVEANLTHSLTRANLIQLQCVEGPELFPFVQPLAGLLEGMASEGVVVAIQFQERFITFLHVLILSTRRHAKLQAVTPPTQSLTHYRPPATSVPGC